ncbi:hypothetical protein PF005_g27141 [Phytophthora fragariae]|uniref:Uncharacterized protein n=1 Tax=Phytophthora fragariae TaxID=53985 RepID=A0A6A3QJD7_9STRA|nr:hypothetical protein PF003_g36820 [Phytophthora fragariae]KAE8922987.1 hypothetical protein PF009_g26756 [Phytophthora fragariae]KAE8973045.1 hypothetical protein PF011_g25405 [Phytophthora fragariae]KAE9068761.1 hypothetical protein PF010_g26934 [Phytophthora fragariae]KAE9076881.1 hypothetical protein PF007_g24459 [Phytophthora fragariae]
MRQHRSHRDGRLSTSKKLLPEPVDEEVAASVLVLFEVDDAILPMVSVIVDDVSDCTYTENVYAIDPLVSLVTVRKSYNDHATLKNIYVKTTDSKVDVKVG